MKLSQNDADLFFKLMWSFQDFVNRELRIHPDIRTLDDYIATSPDEKIEVRQSFIAKRDKLIEAFVEKNPRKLSKEHLKIVSTWKNCVAGEFYIERMLKKYTVFIAKDRSVYGVLGLHDDFDDLFHKSQLPFLAKAVLLPFKGRIVYDGLLQGYNIYFGGGIRRDLKEIYMAAKQNGRIIESLDAETKSAKCQAPKKQPRDWKPEFEELINVA